MNEYWNERYASGGMSGIGFSGTSKKWKWSVIDCFISNIAQIIDVGCRDLSFWEERDSKYYPGMMFQR